MEPIAEILNLHTPIDVVLARLVIASLCGASIGWNREHLDKPAGLRTHMLVCLGSACYMLLAVEMMKDSGGVFDPLRVVTGLLTGIGFLGAGTIIQTGGAVHGMTTAAGIFLVAAIGAMCGVGVYGLAIISTLMGLGILAAAGFLKDITKSGK